MWAWVLGFSLVGSVGGLGGTAIILVVSERVRSTVLPHLISFGTGTLLGLAFLGLLPEALERAPAKPTMMVALAGVLALFALEKVMLWRDCHDPDCEAHHTAGKLILLGDGIHNFLDGITIGAAFVASTTLGVATSLAVLVHELPQEIGDFAVLVESGYEKKRAFYVNFLASLTTVPGALLAYFGLGAVHGAIPYMLAIAGAAFIYVAIGHLIPMLHRRVGVWASLQQVALIGLGVGTIMLLELH